MDIFYYEQGKMLFFFLRINIRVMTLKYSNDLFLVSISVFNDILLSIRKPVRLDTIDKSYLC